MSSSAPVRVLVIGDSTTAVRETAAALADGTPYCYCDENLREGITFSVDFRIVTLTDGTQVQLWPSNMRARYRSLVDAMFSRRDAVLVLFNTHDTFDRHSFVSVYVSQAIESQTCPVTVMPSARGKGAEEFSEGAIQLGRRYVAGVRRRTGCDVEFANVSAQSEPSELRAVLESLVARWRAADVVDKSAPEQNGATSPEVMRSLTDWCAIS